MSHLPSYKKVYTACYSTKYCDPHRPSHHDSTPRPTYSKPYTRLSAVCNCVQSVYTTTAVSMYPLSLFLPLYASPDVSSVQGRKLSACSFNVVLRTHKTAC